MRKIKDERLKTKNLEEVDEDAIDYVILASRPSDRTALIFRTQDGGRADETKKMLAEAYSKPEFILVYRVLRTLPLSRIRRGYTCLEQGISVGRGTVMSDLITLLKDYDTSRIRNNITESRSFFIGTKYKSDEPNSPKSP